MRPFTAFVSYLGAVLFVACGGKVVVDGGPGSANTGGTGGTGTTTSVTTWTGTHTTSSTISTTWTTGTGGADACGTLCAKLTQYGCDEASGCSSQCQGLYGQFPTCTQQVTALLVCYASAVGPDCQFPQTCSDEADALGGCGVGPGGSGGGTVCTPDECTGGGNSSGETFCDCSMTCGAQKYVASCVSQSGQSKCDCYISGGYVGSCGAPEQFACSASQGCCAPYFFGEEG